MCTVPTDKSISGNETLAFHGHVQSTSSPNSETRKDSTPTRSQATRSAEKADLGTVYSRGTSTSPTMDLAGSSGSGLEMSQTGPFFAQFGERRHTSSKPVEKESYPYTSLVAQASLTQLDPELHCGPILMTRRDGKDPVPRGKVHTGMKHIAWNLLLAAQLPSVENLVALDLLRCQRWNTDTRLGWSPLCARFVGWLTRARTSLLIPAVACLQGQVWFLAAVLLQAAVGPCAPSDPVSFSSCLHVSSERAVISGFFLLSQQLRYKTHLVLIDQVHSLS